jgi:hypothetical protein
MKSENNLLRSGQETGQSEMLDECNRYKVFEVYTTFEKTSWILTDAEYIDENGFPMVLSIASTKEQAVKALSKYNPVHFYLDRLQNRGKIL